MFINNVFSSWIFTDYLNSLNFCRKNHVTAKNFCQMVLRIAAPFLISTWTNQKLSQKMQDVNSNFNHKRKCLLWNINVFFVRILGCLILTWYFYERSPLITNGYHCCPIPSVRPLPSKFEPNLFISLQVTVLFAKMEKSEVLVLIKH